MAHHEQRPGEALQLVEQPSLGGAVEVIGGLIEDHQFGLLEEHPHQVHPTSLAPGE